MTPELLKSFVLTMYTIVTGKSVYDLSQTGFLQNLNRVIRLDEDWEWECDATGPASVLGSMFRFAWVSDEKILRFVPLSRARIPGTLPVGFNNFLLFSTVFPEGNIQVRCFANVIEYYL